MLLGAHMSVEGGLANAIDRGESIGCTAIQIFAKNNNRWSAPPYRAEDILAFKKKWKDSKIKIIFSHAGYLINLASPNAESYAKSIASMRDELERAESLGLPFVVMHPGSSLDSPAESGISQLAKALKKLLKETSGYNVKIALENTAGQGNSIGHQFEQISEALDRATNGAGPADPGRLGVCMDTCHTLAAGYDLRTKEAFNKTMAHFEKTIGFGRLLAIHMNDSLKPFGSHVDRHTHIGQGFAGLIPFRLLMNDPRFARIPKVLETPKDKEMTEDMMNLKTLRNLVVA